MVIKSKWKEERKIKREGGNFVTDEDKDTDVGEETQEEVENEEPEEEPEEKEEDD